MTVEETIRAAVATELVPIRSELARLAAQVEAMRRAIPPALVPVREAAEALGVSEITVRRQIKEGLLPVVRFGRCVRVDLAALRAPTHAEVVRLAQQAMHKI